MRKIVTAMFGVQSALFSILLQGFLTLGRYHVSNLVSARLQSLLVFRNAEGRREMFRKHSDRDAEANHNFDIF